VKLWAFLRCPVCGFTGCAAPFEGTPCPMCGFRAGVPDQPPEAAVAWAKAFAARPGVRSTVSTTLGHRRSRSA